MDDNLFEASVGATPGTTDGTAVVRTEPRVSIPSEPRLPSRWLGFASAMFALMLVLTLLHTPFGKPFRYELYGYVLKAFEILHGNWTPMPDNPIGWPIALAGALWVARATNVFQAMVIAHAFDAVLMSLCVFPLGAIASRCLSARAARWAMFVFASASPMLSLGAGDLGAFSEPLYVLLMLWGVYFMTAPTVRLRDVALASAFMALAFYVRASGVVLILPVLLWLASRRLRGAAPWSAFAVAIGVFLAVSLGNTLPRKLAYGSPMNYNVASRFFVTTGRPSSSYNIPSPGVLDYLQSTPPRAIADRFGREGAFGVGKSIADALGPMLYVLCVFGLVHYLAYNRTPQLGAVFVTLVVASVALIPTFGTLGLPRYVMPCFPLLALFGADFIARALEAADKRRAIGAVFAVMLVSGGINSVWSLRAESYEGGRTPVVRDEWAHWIAANIRGRLAFDADYELVHQCLPPAEQRLDIGVSMVAPRTPIVPDFRLTPGPIQPMKLGEYRSLDEALATFRAGGIQYVMLCRKSFDIWPYLRQIDSPEYARHFVLLREFDSTPAQRWEVPEMFVYQVVYGTVNEP